jgi:hypothetical protein
MGWHAWSGVLIVPAQSELMIERGATDPTSESRQQSEGPACHARRREMDHPPLAQRT